MDIYFGVSSRNPVELEVVKEVNPNCIMLSFYYWKNRKLKDLIEYLEYKPKIMIDSGGYSGKVDTYSYCKWLKENEDYIDWYISSDYRPQVMDYKYEDYLPNNQLKLFQEEKNRFSEIYAELTCNEFMLFEDFGLNYPVPVFHYGLSEKYIDMYIENFGCSYIALGNTVSSLHHLKLYKWVNYLTDKYMIDFHVLGSTGKKIIQNCSLLKSCDSTTWIMRSKVYGEPKTLKRVKERGKYQMLEILNNKSKSA